MSVLLGEFCVKWVWYLQYVRYVRYVRYVLTLDLSFAFYFLGKENVLILLTILTLDVRLAVILVSSFVSSYSNIFKF